MGMEMGGIFHNKHNLGVGWVNIFFRGGGGGCKGGCQFLVDLKLALLQLLEFDFEQKY